MHRRISLAQLTHMHQVFVWLDEANHITTGTGPTQHTPPPAFQVSSTVGTGVNGTNETLVYEVIAQRQLSFTSTIHTSKGTKQASWQQTLSFSNYGNFKDAGNAQINSQNTDGVDVSSSGYAKSYHYPLWVNSVYNTIADNFTIQADVHRGKDVQTLGRPVFPTGLESFSAVEDIQTVYPTFQGAALSTIQNGSATYMANTTSSTSSSFGTTEQDMVLAGVRAGASKNAQGFPTLTGNTELFHRYIMAVNGTVTEDEETLTGKSIRHQHIGLDSSRGFANSGVRGMLGRGPAGPGR